jgi:hypothetical protein
MQEQIKLYIYRALWIPLGNIYLTIAGKGN